MKSLYKISHASPMKSFLQLQFPLLFDIIILGSQEIPVFVSQKPFPEQLFGHSSTGSVKLHESPTNPVLQMHFPFIYHNVIAGNSD